MTVPQAMSYANVAGLHAVYGLYSAFVGSLPYPLFGTSPHLAIGPTAILSVMVKHSIPGSLDGDSVIQELHEYLSFALAFFMGFWLVLVGILGIGFLVNLISEPVIHGFTMAAALLVVSTQISSIFGILACTRDDGDACSFVDAFSHLSDSASSIELPTPICSLVSLIFLLTYKALTSRLKKISWISNFGPFLLLIFSLILTYRLDYKNGWGNESNICIGGPSPPCDEGIEVVNGQCCIPSNPFSQASEGNFDFKENVRVYDMSWHIRQIGPVPQGLPSFYSPFRACTSFFNSTEYRELTISISNTSRNFSQIDCIIEQVSIVDNGTLFNGSANVCTFQSRSGIPKLYNMTITENDIQPVQQCLSFDLLKQIVYSSVILSFIAYMEAMTIAKTVSRKVNGCDVGIHPSNELVGLGVSNIFCSFLQGFSVTGSFSRTAVNAEAGATSSLANVFSAFIVFLCLQVLTGILQYLPRFALGAIVLDSVTRLIDLHKPKILWKTDKRDFLVFLVTFTLVLFVGIQDGLIVGILLGWASNLTNFHPSDFFVKNLNAQKSDSPILSPPLIHRHSVYKSSVDQEIEKRHSIPINSSSLLATLVIHHNLEFSGSYRVRDTVQDVLFSCFPRILILDISAVRMVDSTGIHMIDEITTLCIEAKVLLLLLAGTTDQVSQKIRDCASHSKKYQKNWEWTIVHSEVNPTLRNISAKMLMFDSVETATQFAENYIPCALVESNPNQEETTRPSISSSSTSIKESK
eukprot:c13444_g1_i1.p1 GENE.c13444_g1_i1~~c13444_g1_i1.p1  ORF type:complete len:751 (+),score=286.65 c13444_g1_i1:166-2418(+)